MRTRLSIGGNLLELLLFEVERLFDAQPYLECAYKELLSLAYYGLFRIGELAMGDHPVKANDVHIAQNKDKMMFVLYSSKTHSTANKPQRITITANRTDKTKMKCAFCPFKMSREYLAIRGNYREDTEPFFVFRDRAPIHPNNVRKVLKQILKAIDLDPDLYDTHSFRIGRATDMVLKFNKSIESVKIAGRWWSDIVYRYIRPLL